MARYFHGPGCEIVGHQVGDRHWEVGTCDDEWTGSVWARVCTNCDVPILDNDEDGWSCCERCGLRASDVPRRVFPPVVVP